jgi:hypothetical protein
VFCRLPCIEYLLCSRSFLKWILVSRNLDSSKEVLQWVLIKTKPMLQMKRRTHRALKVEKNNQKSKLNCSEVIELKRLSLQENHEIRLQTSGEAHSFGREHSSAIGTIA